MDTAVLVHLYKISQKQLDYTSNGLLFTFRYRITFVQCMTSFQNCYDEKKNVDIYLSTSFVFFDNFFFWLKTVNIRKLQLQYDSAIIYFNYFYGVHGNCLPQNLCNSWFNLWQIYHCLNCTPFCLKFFLYYFQNINLVKLRHRILRLVSIIYCSQNSYFYF